MTSDEKYAHLYALYRQKIESRLEALKDAQIWADAAGMRGGSALREQLCRGLRSEATALKILMGDVAGSSLDQLIVNVEADVLKIDNLIGLVSAGRIQEL